MAQSQNQPLYWDKDRVPVNLTLILALGIALWGLAGNFELIPFGGSSPQLIIVLGVGVAVYTWLMTPRQYLVYADALCIVYGRPRVKTLHFRDIDAVELGSLSALDRLRVRPRQGRRQSIRVREVEAFYEQLEGALSAFRAAHPEYGPPAAAEALPGAAATAAVETEAGDAGEPEPAKAAEPEAAAESTGGAETAAEAGEEPPPEHRPIY